MKLVKIIFSIVFICLALVSLYIGMNRPHIPDEFDNYEEFEKFITDINGVERIELKDIGKDKELKIYLLDSDPIISIVDKAIDRFFLSSSIYIDLKGNYITVQYYYDDQILWEDKSNKILSSNNIIWSVELYNR